MKKTIFTVLLVFLLGGYVATFSSVSSGFDDSAKGEAAITEKSISLLEGKWSGCRIVTMKNGQKIEKDTDLEIKTSASGKPVTGTFIFYSRLRGTLQKDFSGYIKNGRLWIREETENYCHLILWRENDSWEIRGEEKNPTVNFISYRFFRK